MKNTQQNYVGGLEPTLFHNEKLAAYVKGDIVGGYLGHSVRVDWLDAMMCEVYLTEVNKYNFAVWLTTNDARDFAEKLECMIEDCNSYDSVRPYLEKMMPRVYNMAFILGSPEHTGRIGCTDVLYDKYNKQGLLM